MPMTPSEARSYLDRWKLVREVELAELRSASTATKLQQLGALMASRHIFGADPRRQTEELEARERWADLRRALGG